MSSDRSDDTARAWTSKRDVNGKGYVACYMEGLSSSLERIDYYERVRRTVDTQHPISHRSDKIESAVSSNRLLDAAEFMRGGNQPSLCHDSYLEKWRIARKRSTHTKGMDPKVSTEQTSSSATTGSA